MKLVNQVHKIKAKITGHTNPKMYQEIIILQKTQEIQSAMKSSRNPQISASENKKVQIALNTQEQKITNKKASGSYADDGEFDTTLDDDLEFFADLDEDDEDGY